MTELNRNVIWVKLRDWAALAQTLADLGVFSFAADAESIGWLAVDTAGQDCDALLAGLSSHPNVLSATFEGYVHLTAVEFISARVREPLAVGNEYGHGPGDPAQYDNLNFNNGTDLTPEWYYPLTWHHARMNTYRAWKETKGSKRVKTMVIDTGYDPHPDLPALPEEDMLWPASNALGDYSEPVIATYSGMAPDFLAYAYNQSVGGKGSGYYEGSSGHGRMCSSIIAAKHNERGIAGIAPETRFLAVSGRGLPQTGVSPEDYPSWGISYASAVAGLIWAGDSGAKIVSCSWYAGSDPNPVADAVRYAQARGVLVFTGTGNGYILMEGNFVPRSVEGVIVVSALDANGGRICYAEWGPRTDIVAPANPGFAYDHRAHYANSMGVEWNNHLLALRTDHGVPYSSGDGVSAATPVCAGVAALIWAINPDFTSSQVAHLLLSTVSPFLDYDCDTVYFPGVNSLGYGKGVPNAAKGVLKAKSMVTAGVHPYLGFLSLGYNDERPFKFSDFRANWPRNRTSLPRPQTVWHTADADGKVTVRLGGRGGVEADVWVELAGYHGGADADSIELWVDGVRIYSGPPTCLRARASFSGTRVPVQVVARMGGESAEETYDDIDVSDLTLLCVDSIENTLGAVTVRGNRNEGSQVLVNGVAASLTGPSAWEFTASAGVTQFTVSDGDHSIVVGTTAEASGRAGGRATLTLSSGSVPLSGVAVGSAEAGQGPLSGEQFAQPSGAAGSYEYFQVLDFGRSVLTVDVPFAHPTPGPLPDVSVPVSGSASWNVGVA